MRRRWDQLPGLPHRAPALLIEALEHPGGEVDPLRSPEAILRIGSAAHWMIEGRLSVAGLVEALAQAAVLCVDSQSQDGPTCGPEARTAGVLIGLEDISISALPCSGQIARIRSTGSRRIGPALWVETEMVLDDSSSKEGASKGKTVAGGVVKVFLGRPPSEERTTCSAPGLLSEECLGAPGDDPEPKSLDTEGPGVRETVLGAVLSVESEGSNLLARCAYASSLPIFRGHFPGRPLVPGVYGLQLVLELLASAGYDPGPPITVRRAKLASPVLPEQEHSIEIRASRSESEGQTVSARLYTAGCGTRPAAELLLEIGSGSSYDGAGEDRRP